jgi:hypothetical protein
MKKPPLVFFFFAVPILLLLVYLGLNVAERGIREISVPPETGRVLHISCDEKEIVIIFAGDHYYVPYGRYLQKIRRK